MLPATRPLILKDVVQVLRLTADADALAAFTAVGDIARETIGWRLYTVLAYIDADTALLRVHSSDTAAFPPGTRLPMPASASPADDVFLAPDKAAVERAYPDNAILAAHAITAILNVPIRVQGRRIGTLNLSGEAGMYGSHTLDTARTLASLLAPLLQAAGDGILRTS